ncbi:MAG TPA: trypsin-like peptidase domain-containing protein [Spirochaetia bacterium]
MKAWLRARWPRLKVPALLVGNVALVVVALLVYSALRPLPPRLTQRDIDAAVTRSMAAAPIPPSYASQAYDIIRPSVVVVASATGTDASARASLGAGVVVSEQGMILTCLHVVGDASQVKVVFADGTESTAEVTVRVPQKDLAVLSALTLPDDLKPATLASSSTLRVGDEVIAVGNPFGVIDSVTDGIVSGLGRVFASRGTRAPITNLIQFDAAVNPGNSGGPLVDRAGEVVGIVASLLNPTSDDVFIGIGFAIPIDDAGGALGIPPV